jgi:hypothetical protein
VKERIEKSGLRGWERIEKSTHQVMPYTLFRVVGRVSPVSTKPGGKAETCTRAPRGM